MIIPSTEKVYVIAEAGVNHNGSMENAFALIDAAADAGADAVKFQTFDAKRLAAASAPKAAYQKATTDLAQSQLEMLQALELPLDWHAPLQAHAHQRGIEFLSTAFDMQSLEFLKTLALPFFKVPSGELTNLPLLWQFARTGKPLVLSTGMATLSEVEQALAVVVHGRACVQEPGALDDVWKLWSDRSQRDALTDHIVLLHCTSQYPAPPEEVNLLAMDTLADAFGVPVGYSDHTQGILIPVAAVARGACMIEKHFTLDRNLPGPDHKASLEPSELAQMVSDIRNLERSFGNGVKAPQISEWDTRAAARQQVVAARIIRQGATIQRQDLTTARCGSGLPASRLWEVVGQVAERDYGIGEVI